MIILIIIGAVVAITMIGFIILILVSIATYNKYNGDGYCTLICDRCEYPDIECEDCTIAINHYKNNNK